MSDAGDVDHTFLLRRSVQLAAEQLAHTKVVDGQKALEAILLHFLTPFRASERAANIAGAMRDHAEDRIEVLVEMLRGYGLDDDALERCAKRAFVAWRLATRS